jgi:hydrogenase maturation protease
MASAAAVQRQQGARTLVLGIGNTLLCDEGVGVVVMEALSRRLGERDDLEFMDGGTLSFTLAGPIAEHDGLIVIDAAEMGARPGSVAVFANEEMDRFLGSNRKRSVHEVSLIDLMAVALLEGCLPPRRALIAIQPALVDWGERLSPPVAAALDEACDRAQRLIEGWQT